MSLEFCVSYVPERFIRQQPSKAVGLLGLDQDYLIGSITLQQEDDRVIH